MKKILKSILAFVLLLPCALLFTACGKLKSLEGKTFNYSKVEVTGSANKQEYENLYRGISFKFSKSTVVYVDVGVEDTYNYKYENAKVYLSSEGEEFGTKPYAELSGEYMILSQSVEGGTVKIYFKLK